MKFEKWYKEARVVRYDETNLRVVRYTRTNNEGTREKLCHIIEAPQGIIARFFQPNPDPSLHDYEDEARIAFSIQNDGVLLHNRLDDKNLRFGVVKKIFRRDFYAIVETTKGPIRLNCSDAHIEPIHDDVMELKTGQPILIGCLRETIEGRVQDVGYRIEPLYNISFPGEATLPWSHDIGFIWRIIEDENRVVYVSFSNMTRHGVSHTVTKLNQRDDWMEEGMLCFWRCYDGETTVDNFKCLGKIYNYCAIGTKKVFQNVPCVYRRFNSSHQSMWNDYFGLIECEGEGFVQLEYEIRNLDIIYLDVICDNGVMKGSNPRMVDRYVENSLRENCSQILQTADFCARNNTASKTTLITKDNVHVEFNHLPRECMPSNVEFVRITYYPDGSAYSPFLVTVLSSYGETWGDLLPMRGIARNPNVRYDVEKITEESNEGVGYISKYSHNPNEPFYITFLNGVEARFPAQTKEEWMNYGVFVKHILGKRLMNLGYMCPINSNRREKSIVLPATASVKVTDGYVKIFGIGTILGNVRVRESEEYFESIEHESKILLKNIRYETSRGEEEWTAEFDNIY